MGDRVWAPFSVDLMLSGAGPEQEKLDLFAFGFDGWEGHPWIMEKRYMWFHEFKGRLSLNPPGNLATKVPQLMDQSPGELALQSAGKDVQTNTMGELILKLLELKLGFSEICDGLKACFDSVPDSADLEIAQFLWRLEDLNQLFWSD